MIEVKFLISKEAALTPCSNKCHNGQRCSYDFDNRRYACLCEMPYTGMYCEKSRAMEFLFTSLGAQGNTGPTSTAGYKHTPLQGTVTLNKGIQIWTVPFTARYCVTVVGASGGNGLEPGGKGAIVSGIVRLIKGTVLHLLIGQKGVKGSSAAGGGGGTFVVFSNNTLIAAAGGGGGGGGQITSKVGDDGQKGRKGSNYGGVNGLGGKVCANESNNAGGGGGFRGDGKCSLNITCVSPRSCKEAGMSYLNGGVGGEGNGNGGFGGGGAAFKDFAGGGGGYSGGGVHATSFASRTGGGGSFDDGVPVSSSGVSHNSADGYVSFRYP
ncbi:hypothetical protein AWC38_SpisGene7294 [Stylophora pistillata]|uniref:EGF-like domain-containing protein n=1 Tax=Stylophora pistillata TaxID=50429 RepID=A0A2B4SHD5_STYPI|nr:hypothetical protein AWC38_SpisGene7294 [Stylophora pistillata]